MSLRSRRKHSTRSRLLRERTGLKQLPWQRVRRAYEPIELLTKNQVEVIHRASLDILRDTGVHFMGKKVRDFLVQIPGIRVDEASEIVRFEPMLVEDAMNSIPAEFTIHARNPAHNIHVGGKDVNFTNAITPPYVNDLDHGKRPGTEEEFKDLLRLCQCINAVHFVFGYPVEPQDLAVETRHLDAYMAYITLTDKVWRGYTMGDDRIYDAIEMARIARGISHEVLLKEPSFIANVTTNSPLRIDEPMGDGLMIMAKKMQPVSISAFTMAGAIAPITLAGALAQQNAEILAAATLSQLVNPGAPLVYGAFTVNVHMRSGAIGFGSPEFMKATIASGQLARRYSMPFKAAVTTGSKVVDAQAAYETQASLWAAIAAGGNIIAHACGWLESGMTLSREKMIVDAEMIQTITEVMKPIVIDEDNLALSTIDKVGPGGNYFDSPLTMNRFKTAFYEPLLSDWENYESWEERGAETAEQRANVLWKTMLDEYQQPALDSAIKQKLEAYVSQRRYEIKQAEILHPKS